MEKYKKKLDESASLRRELRVRSKFLRCMESTDSFADSRGGECFSRRSECSSRGGHKTSWIIEDLDEFLQGSDRSAGANSSGTAEPSKRYDEVQDAD